MTPVGLIQEILDRPRVAFLGGFMLYISILVIPPYPVPLPFSWVWPPLFFISGAGATYALLMRKPMAHSITYLIRALVFIRATMVMGIAISGRFSAPVGLLALDLEYAAVDAAQWLAVGAMTVESRLRDRDMESE